jgi:hypothetical protein
MPQDEIVHFSLQYAARLKLPIHCGVNATVVIADSNSGDWTVTTRTGILQSKNVVVAIGLFPLNRPVLEAIITPNGEIQFPRVLVFVRRDLFTAVWRLNLEHVVGGTADLSWNYLSLDQPAPRTAPPEHMRSTHY